MIINLVLFFIPKRQEIYRLYLIKKRKKLACMRLNSNVKRKDIYGKSISIDLQMYKTAIVFGTINTTSETLLLVTRQYNDVVVVESLHGASKERVTGIVDSKTNTVTLTFPGNNSAIIIW